MMSEIRKTKKEKMTKLRQNSAGFAHTMAILSLVVLAGVGGAGYRVYVSSHSKPKLSVNDSTPPSQLEPLATDLTGVKTLPEIQTVAAASAGTVQIKSIQLETENGVLVYKVVLADKTVLVFDAKTGAQLPNTKVPESEVGTEDLPKAVTTAVTVDKAREIAQASRVGKTITKIELEKENAVLVFSVRFSDGVRVNIDANTGAIVVGSNSSVSDKTSAQQAVETPKASSGDVKKTETHSTTEIEHATPTPAPSPESAASTITEAQAKTIANNRLPGKTIGQVQNETDDGAAVWSVRFSDGSRVDVRKSDGVIVKVLG